MLLCARESRTQLFCSVDVGFQVQQMCTEYSAVRCRCYTVPIGNQTGPAPVCTQIIIQPSRRWGCRQLHPQLEQETAHNSEEDFNG
jgi:hypothetical protein